MKGLKRRFTLPVKVIDKLSPQHQIKSRKDFEDAVHCVFEKEIANKSLGRKSRISEDILLDNHAFSHKNTSFERNTEKQARMNSFDSSQDFSRSTSYKNLNTKNVRMATVGKQKKKFMIKIEKKNKQNLKI
jgi:hypothetical protein